jgi:hypothetical protein
VWNHFQKLSYLVWYRVPILVFFILVTTPTSQIRNAALNMKDTEYLALISSADTLIMGLVASEPADTKAHEALGKTLCRQARSREARAVAGKKKVLES